MYAKAGRRSIPPETLLKSTLLMALYSVPSERELRAQEARLRAEIDRQRRSCEPRLSGTPRGQ
jgi:transposase